MDNTTRAVAALTKGARELAGNFMVPAAVPQALTIAAGALQELGQELQAVRRELQELRELPRGGCEGCGGKGGA